MIFEYVLDNYNASDSFIERYSQLFILPPEIAESNEAIRNYLKKPIELLIGVILSDLKNDFNLGTRIFFDEGVFGSYNAESVVKALISSPIFYYYVKNQLNTSIKHFFFNEYLNQEQFLKEIIDEKTAFYIKFNSGEVNQLVYLIKNDPNPKEAFHFLTNLLFEIKTNRNLLDKLPERENNPLIKFIPDAKDYVRDINSDIMATNTGNNVIDSNKRVPKTFESLFQDKNTYESLINFMISEERISSINDSLIWKGFKRNAKHELSAFHEACFDAGLLKQKALNDTDLATIAQNTFYGLTVVDRTLRSTPEKRTKAFLKYRDLIARFTSL